MKTRPLIWITLVLLFVHSVFLLAEDLDAAAQKLETRLRSQRLSAIDDPLREELAAFFKMTTNSQQDVYRKADVLKLLLSHCEVSALPAVKDILATTLYWPLSHIKEVFLESESEVKRLATDPNYEVAKPMVDLILKFNSYTSRFGVESAPAKTRPPSWVLEAFKRKIHEEVGTSRSESLDGQKQAVQTLLRWAPHNKSLVDLLRFGFDHCQFKDTYGPSYLRLAAQFPEETPQLLARVKEIIDTAEMDSHRLKDIGFSEGNISTNATGLANENIQRALITVLKRLPPKEKMDALVALVNKEKRFDRLPTAQPYYAFIENEIKPMAKAYAKNQDLSLRTKAILVTNYKGGFRWSLSERTPDPDMPLPKPEWRPDEDAQTFYHRIEHATPDDPVITVKGYSNMAVTPSADVIKEAIRILEDKHSPKDLVAVTIDSLKPLVGKNAEVRKAMLLHHTDEDPYVRQAVAEAFVVYGIYEPQIAPEVLELESVWGLRTNESLISDWVQHVGKISDAQTIERLLKRGEYHPSYMTKQGAMNHIAVLQKISVPDDRITQLMGTYLSLTDREHRREVISHMRRVESHCLDNLRGLILPEKSGNQ